MLWFVVTMSKSHLCRTVYPDYGSLARWNSSIIAGLLEVESPEPRSLSGKITFNPERFLNGDGTFRDDPTISLAFGGGKRVCPTW
jgi:hypothetical protein